MDNKTKTKIKQLQQVNLGFKKRVELILELEEFLLKEAHICPNFRNLIETLREYLKDGNGKYEVISERIVSEISADLKNYLDKAEAKNE